MPREVRRQALCGCWVATAKLHLEIREAQGSLGSAAAAGGPSLSPALPTSVPAPLLLTAQPRGKVQTSSPVERRSLVSEASKFKTKQNKKIPLREVGKSAEMRAETHLPNSPF